MSDVPTIRFDQADLHQLLERLDADALDRLAFGAIGFLPSGEVNRYNATEIRSTGLARDRVIGRPLFTEIAQCMNNYLVAQRFDDAAAAGQPLDVVIDYVLTWRMKPVGVQMRLLLQPDCMTRYVLIQRSA